MAEADLGLGAAGPAREAFASLAANEPVRTRALQGLGLANLRLGDRDAALAALELATEADPKLWRAWVGLARLHDGKGEWDLATKAYDQALATAPDRGLVLNNRGVSMLARGEPAEAAKQFEQALQVRPDLATAKANLRLALAMAGHDGDILAASGTEELPQVLNNLGFIAMVQGDLPRAESYFYRAIEASPTFYQRAYDNLQRLDQLRERDTSRRVVICDARGRVLSLLRAAICAACGDLTSFRIPNWVSASLVLLFMINALPQLGEIAWRTHLLAGGLMLTGGLCLYGPQCHGCR